MADPELTKPTHLTVDVLHRLMRLFMEHKTDVLPVVERGRIVGQLDRLAIMEALSEIKPEGYTLTIKPAESADELLKLLDTSGANALATINRNFEFNALWSRAEILQAQGKMPQVQIWQPSTSQPLSSTPEMPKTQIQQVVEDLPHHASPSQTDKHTDFSTTITIQREVASPSQPPPRTGEISNSSQRGWAEGGSEKNTRPVAEKYHRELERGRLAINTLASLEIPLLACDGIGTEIFHNRAFADIRLRDAMYLKSEDLVVRAKDAITESALKGELDIDRAVKLETGPRGYQIFCKAIRDYDNPAARAVGYIFWLLAASPPPPNLLPLSVSRGENNATTWRERGGTEGRDRGEGEYAGRTLPEILAAEEARAMAWAMHEANDNQSDAALLLGIPRQTFNYRYRRLTRAKHHTNVRRPKAPPSTPEPEIKISDKKKK